MPAVERVTAVHCDTCICLPCFSIVIDFVTKDHGEEDLPNFYSILGGIGTGFEQGVEISFLA